MSSRRTGVILCVLALAVGGCSGRDNGYAELGLIPVTGKVTLDGQPLAGARIQFESTDGRNSTGATDANGQYTIMYDSEHPGATPGMKIVRITQRGGSGQTGGEEGADPDGITDEGTRLEEPIPAVYNRQSTLTADVSQSSRTFNFDLKSRP